MRENTSNASKIKLTYTKNPRNFLKNFKNQINDRIKNRGKKEGRSFGWLPSSSFLYFYFGSFFRF